MQKSEILIEQDTLGTARPVVVAMDVPISMLLPKLVEILKLPQSDLFGKPLIYTLRHAASGRILAKDKTLTEVGILSGMRLMLDSSITESIPVPIAPVASNLKPRPASPFNPIDPSLHTSDTLSDNALTPALTRNQTGHTPDTGSIKKRSNLSRRTFLAAFGTLCGVGGIGVGYAAYRGVFNSAPASKTTTTTHIVKHTAAAPKAPVVHTTTLKERLTFNKHQQTVRTVAWAPTGNMLASGSDDTHVFLWICRVTCSRILIILLQLKPSPGRQTVFTW
ncbi:EsaB/YukD family protein [Dictyobacter kobayashii]|nr:EsaB/YukD family protein [Dictyobacter kobayashii]